MLSKNRKGYENRSRGAVNAKFRTISEAFRQYGRDVTYHEIFRVRVAYETVASCFAGDLVSNDLCFHEALPSLVWSKSFD